MGRGNLLLPQSLFEFSPVPRGNEGKQKKKNAGKRQQQNMRCCALSSSSPLHPCLRICFQEAECSWLVFHLSHKKLFKDCWLVLIRFIPTLQLGRVIDSLFLHCVMSHPFSCSSGVSPFVIRPSCSPVPSRLPSSALPATTQGRVFFFSFSSLAERRKIAGYITGMT